MNTWATVLVAFFTAIPPTLVALATLVRVLRAEKKVDELHNLTNSRMSELLEKTASASRAEGEAAGQKTERDRKSRSK